MRLDTTEASELHSKRRQMVEAAKRHRSGFKDPSFFEERNCPVCSSETNSLVLESDGGKYVRCKDCRMIFLNPVLSDKYLNLYYSTNHAEQAMAHPSEKSFYDKIYNLGFQNCRKLASINTVLDIGCSDGAFLDLVREEGCKTFGVELNEQEILLAKAKSHEIWTGSAFDIPEDSKFDLISLWDVFEHIKDGKGLLKTLTRHLNTNGIIFLQVPNSGSLAARILREECNMFDGIEHVNLYDKKTVNKVAESVGLRVVDIYSVIDELAPIQNYLNYESPYEGSFENLDELVWMDSKNIHENLLGYKLQVLLTL
jgi:SAM-dependent methyltransferase